MIGNANSLDAFLAQYAVPLSASERTRCANAVDVVRNAVTQSLNLAALTTRVIVQGSYRNSTNVRQQGDVDVTVVCDDAFFYDFVHAPGATPTEAGFVPSSLAYMTYRELVGDALRDYLGTNAVRRGAKVFQLRENSYRVDADVLCAFEHRRYARTTSGMLTYNTGIEFVTDSGHRRRNWPEQHYENAVAKNQRTNGAFKTMVRGLKAVRDEMQVDWVAGSDIPSFLLESLVYDVPDVVFTAATQAQRFRGMLSHILINLHEDIQCASWTDVSGYEWLFRPESFSAEDARTFVKAAWQFVGF